jgi:2-oxoglutarate dehydrogenase E2 component (dihydrolipoamide succinyltransferase)
MAIDLEIPSVGESVSEATISQWLKSEGDWVDKDEPVVELETDKVTVELPSPAAGVLVKILKEEGDSAEVGDVIGQIDDSAERPSEQDEERASEEEKRGKEEKPRDEERGEEPRVMPAARRLLEEHDLAASDVEPTGPGGRLLKEDVERHVAEQKARPAEEPPTESGGAAEAHEEVVPMSPIRRRIAERLVEAQRQAALLTTFNEVDMSEVMRLRREYRDAFEKEHGIRLGFMSFFVKATVDALRQFPQLNAEVRGTDIVYRNRYDIGIAVSTDRGLVVPVLRQAETLGFSEIEKTIHDFAERGRNSKLKLHELEGGTFTITNGGVFGSMLSTPIVNPPQSGVLGLHAIEERPVAVDGEVVVHPMMYVALTYDHRIVDGREAVTFLKRIKDAIADPARLLLEV